MCYVNYVRESMAFMEYASDERISGSERLLWQALFHIMNQRAKGSDWPEGFISIPNARILFYASFGEDTLVAARNKLKQRGLIDFTPGKKNKAAPQYKMNYFSAELSTGNEQNVDGIPKYSGNASGNIQGNIGGNISGNTRGNTSDIYVNLYSNPNRNPCEDEDIRLVLIKDGTEAYRKHFGKEPAAAEIASMAKIMAGTDMDDELLAEAIKIAAEAGASHPLMYVRTLLRDWKYEYVFSVDDLTEYLYLKNACDGKNSDIDRERAYDMALDAQYRRKARAKRQGLRVIG